MRILFHSFIFFLFLFFQNVTSKAFVLSNRAEISVLTCSPGDEAYSVYGHSAIRVKDVSYDYDVVFNYGIFDFSAPNFLYRFASGQTDYLLGAYGFPAFVGEYRAAKRSIYEQVLNLTPSEKQKVFDFLLWNAQPENRVYRYNFFFDNCATRVRDVVQEQTQGSVVFPEYSEDPKTFRELIKKYHSKMLWLNFGIDLVIAAPADTLASAFDEMFLPDYIMQHFAHSTIKAGNEIRPLIKNSRVIYQAAALKITSPKIISPEVVFGILLVLVVYVSVRQFRKKKINHLADYLVFGMNGFMGIVMLWFVLYSEHPAMHPNYNLLWAVPLNLVFAILWKIKKWRTATRYYFFFILVWMLGFILFSAFLPQKFHVVFYLLGSMVLVRALLNSVFILKSKSFTL
jgi:hypothetical protein